MKSFIFSCIMLFIVAHSAHAASLDERIKTLEDTLQKQEQMIQEQQKLIEELRERLTIITLPAR